MKLSHTSSLTLLQPCKSIILLWSFPYLADNFEMIYFPSLSCLFNTTHALCTEDLLSPAASLQILIQHCNRHKWDCGDMSAPQTCRTVINKFDHLDHTIHFQTKLQIVMLLENFSSVFLLVIMWLTLGAPQRQESSACYTRDTIMKLMDVSMLCGFWCEVNCFKST
jgi:hypothetical protein